MVAVQGLANSLQADNMASVHHFFNTSNSAVENLASTMDEALS